MNRLSNEEMDKLVDKLIKEMEEGVDERKDN